MLKRFIALLLPALFALPLLAQWRDLPVLLPVKVDKKWGFINDSGRVVIEPQYEAAESFDKKLFTKVMQGGKPYIINRSGKTIEAPINGGFTVFDDSLLLVKTNDTTFALMSFDGAVVYPPRYSKIQMYNMYNLPKTILLQQGDKKGIGTVKGKMILDISFTILKEYLGYYIAGETDTTLAVYRANGSPLLPHLFDEIEFGSYLSNRILTHTKDGWGMYDTLGKNIVAQYWDKLTVISDNFILGNHGDSTALLCRKTGRWLQAGGYKWIKTASGGRLMVTDYNERRGILGDEGQVLVPLEFDDVQWRDEMYLTIKDGQRGLYTFDGKKIFDPQFRYIDYFQENVALVGNGPSWGVINSFGEIIAPLEYDEIDLTDNSAKARKGTKYTVYELTDKGRLYDKLDYNNVMTINVGNRNQNSYIRKRSSTAISAQGFNNSTSAQQGWFIDTATKKYGFRDTLGKVVIPPSFDKINNSSTSQWCIVEVISAPYTVDLFGIPLQFSSKKGIVDQSNGAVMIKPAFAYIDDCVLGTTWFGYARALTVQGFFNVINDMCRIQRIQNCRFIDKKSEGLSRFYVGEIGLYKSREAKAEALNLYTVVNEMGAQLPEHLRGGWNNYNRIYLDFIKGSWSYINPKGYKTNFECAWACNFINGRAIVKQTAKYGVINANMEYIMAPEHEKIEYLPNSANTRFLVTTPQPTVGFIDEWGLPTADFCYAKAGQYKEGRAWVAINQGNQQVYKFIDPYGGTVGVKEKGYYRVLDFSEGRAAVRSLTDRRWGFIDESGIQLGKFVYMKAGSFHEGRAWVKSGSKYGYVNENGHEIISPRYAKAEDFSNGLAAVATNRRFGYIDDGGKMIISETYIKAEKFDSAGFARVMKTRRYGLISKDGKTIIPFKYSYISPVYDGVCLARKKSKWFLYNTKGELLKRLGRLNRVDPFVDGLARAERDGKFGFIDTRGEWALQPLSGTLKRPENGVAICGVKGRSMGLLGANGDILVPFIYSQVAPLGEDLYMLKDKNTGLTNVVYADGKTIILRDVQEIKRFNNGHAPAKKNDKWGVVNTDGIWLLEPKYDDISEFSEGRAIARVNSVSAIAGLDGVFIIKGVFEKLEYNTAAKAYRLEQAGKIGYYCPDRGWIWQMQE